MPLYLEGQNLSANKILSTYLNSWLIYIYFRFVKKISAYTNSTSGFDFDHSTQFACYFALHFLILSKSDHLLRKYDVISIFLRWRQRPLNSTSGFVFFDVTAFRMRTKSVSKPNFVDNWRLRYNYFRFWKTNVRHFVILLPVWSRISTR